MNEFIKKNGINFGLILGFLLILPTMLGYAFDISLLVSYWTLAYVFLAVIILGILVIAFSKKALGGFISFKQAFASYFIMIIVSFFLSTLLNFALFNVIDKDFEQVVKEEQIALTEKQRDFFANQMGDAPQDKVDEFHDKFDEAIEKIKEDKPYSPLSLLKGFTISIAIFAVFGLLLALILKKKDPALE
ncbi:Protein of unknown function [Lutibacter oricola]|uniref:DUF4199 domain-containing protein n=1 Tax=Lutibacter oricola TaxID=762486 RepID=A0A1H3ABH6_9FLAO|nr:DUF4199 domain-containing protein [Lutibacter oricola]SDX27070.1 Protein of unknown function [Lutibacter oricola]